MAPLPLQAAFSVNLIDAVTMKPFQEVLGPNGRAYVLIKPGKEYFVSIRTNEVSPRFKAEIFVDGESLGYRYRSKNEGSCHKILGLRSVKGNKNLVHALKFENCQRQSNELCSNDADCRTVRVEFHRVAEKWELKKDRGERDTDIRWSGLEKHSKEGLCSTAGTIETDGPAISKRTFHTGSFLTDVTMYYRTADELLAILRPHYSNSRPYKAQMIHTRRLSRSASMGHMSAAPLSPIWTSENIVYGEI